MQYGGVVYGIETQETILCLSSIYGCMHIRPLKRLNPSQMQNVVTQDAIR